MCTYNFIECTVLHLFYKKAYYADFFKVPFMTSQYYISDETEESLVHIVKGHHLKCLKINQRILQYMYIIEHESRPTQTHRLEHPHITPRHIMYIGIH